MAKIIVLKFGSSVLRSENDLPAVVGEIRRWWRRGFRVVAVVSALGNTTDDLTKLARSVSHDPDHGLLATLLATGEAASSALLGLALKREDLPVTVLDADQAKLSTDGPIIDATLISVEKAKVLSALLNTIVVIPGFVGRGRNGELTLLGRGGSDLTALFLAVHLGGSCRLIKDVDGLYTCDPNAHRDSANRFAQASYETARQVGGAVVQRKAVEFAEKRQLGFAISSINSDFATEVGPFSDCLDCEIDALAEECVA